MKRQLIIAAFFVLLAGMANGVMDDLQFHYYDSIASNWNEQFWNPEISWRNKYASTEEGALVRPLQSKFFGSTSFLVFLTDGWHLFKFIFLLCLHMLIALLLVRQKWTWKTLVKTTLIWLAVYSLQTAGFYITYSLF